MGKHVGYMYAQTVRDETQANITAMSSPESNSIHARGLGRHTKKVNRHEKKRRRNALREHINSFRRYVG